MGTWYTDDERMPSQPGPAFGDSIGAMTIAGGIATALFHRERTGEVVALEVSLLGTGLWAMGAGVAMSHVNNTPWRPVDLSGLTQPLLGNYVTADGLHRQHHLPSASPVLAGVLPGNRASRADRRRAIRHL